MAKIFIPHIKVTTLERVKIFAFFYLQKCIKALNIGVFHVHKSLFLRKEKVYYVMKFFLLKKRDSLMRKMSEILHTIKFTYLVLNWRKKRFHIL